MHLRNLIHSGTFLGGVSAFRPSRAKFDAACPLGCIVIPHKILSIEFLIYEAKRLCLERRPTWAAVSPWSGLVFSLRYKSGRLILCVST